LEREWVTDIRDRCLESGTPFFFKQWGGTNKRRTGRILEGRTWDQMPTAAGVHNT
jgi:protein gp37